MQRASDLPSPEPAALEHSRRVVAHIAAEIRAAGGWIGFARYMDLALYTPGLGYYSAGATKLGAAGDFVTAPEISPLFARCVARCLAPWLGAAPGRVILELGAGTGSLAAELLDALARMGVGGVPYRILEVSADLRERQRATIAARVPTALARVQWIDALPAEPVDGVILGNEVVDALPVTRFQVAADAVLELGVSLADERFVWAARPASTRLANAVAGIQGGLSEKWPAGYASELSPQLAGWVEALSATLGRGFVLLSDYGAPRREYYHFERSAGTLICHYRHRAHADPFFLPGLQDISAWVDFTAVAEAAEIAGLSMMGFTTQAHFLADAGIGAELAASAGRDGVPDPRFVRQARALLMPGEMGERFKVMALGRGCDVPPGFAMRDLRHLL